MSEGKSFHIHAPVTGKARRPTVESLTAGTDRLSVIEDRSLCRDRMSAVRVNCRYCKASACSVRHQSHLLVLVDRGNALTISLTYWISLLIITTRSSAILEQGASSGSVLQLYLRRTQQDRPSQQQLYVPCLINRCPLVSRLCPHNSSYDNFPYKRMNRTLFTTTLQTVSEWGSKFESTYDESGRVVEQTSEPDSKTSLQQMTVFCNTHSIQQHQQPTSRADVIR